MIYRVIGRHGTFQRNVVHTRPDNSIRFEGTIYLGEVADQDFDDFEKTITATNVDNETVEWDCQGYVLEILDNLEDAYIIDGDDETFQKQKQKLKNMRAEY